MEPKELSLPERFAKMEKLNPPQEWIDKKLKAGYKLCMSLPVNAEEIGDETLLILQRADKTCYYELYDKMEPITNNFKIYRIEKNKWFVIEVQKNG